MNRVRVALAAALALAAVLLLARAATRPEPVTTLARTDPAALQETLAALDRARAAAYADPVTADPDEWAARHCPCHAEDARRLRSLAAHGRSLRGQRTDLLTLTVARAGPESADLVVTDATTAYDAVDARGRTVTRWPASGVQRWRVTLVRAAGRWLFGAVARAP